jgi:hypothetical protein
LVFCNFAWQAWNNMHLDREALWFISSHTHTIHILQHILDNIFYIQNHHIFSSSISFKTTKT